MKKRSKKETQILVEKMKNFIRQHGEEYLKDPNISSIGIGLKRKKDKSSEELCLQFTVDEKVEAVALESLGSTMIPEKIKINGEEVRTDVVQRKYRLAFQVVEEIVDNDRKLRLDPIMPGISIGNAKGGAGTLGGIVYDRKNGTPYALSNWHVLHGREGELGDPIVQPGPYDDNRVNLNFAGRLVRSHLGIAGDCAISSIEGRQYREEIFELSTDVEQICEPELLDTVIKSGRTTGVTYGRVERIHVIVEINYGRSVGVKKIGCFEIGIDENTPPRDGEISMPGDSGACWMISENGDATNIMAGLHFAGEAKDNPHEHALACYPEAVFKKLGIRTA